METLDKHFRDLTRAAFARYGFAAAELFGRWPEIVGEDLARVSAPERITWPRGAGEDRQKTGGTLVVRAAPGRALELSYAAPRIIDEVNRFHGYGAIAAVRVVTAPAWAVEVPKSAPQTPPQPAAEALVSTIDDKRLQAALRRLGSGVAGKASPQDK
ncbi:MAG: DUF721 domain-containing protein [Rhizobiales bacterium]|nr:DUF721 domain-containing protein [Hyphomicrobiales bacterium]MBI3673626.1 DUF721 domain-containing protein [Hyphomicrobiales bacterium]